MATRRVTTGLIAAALLLIAGACTPASVTKGPLVLAAASLQDALTEAAGAWTAQGHPPPILSFAATSSLARQVEAGAPADLFIAADEEWMDAAERKGHVASATRVTFLSNRLVLIVPADSDVALTIAPGFPLAQALGSGRLAMADPDAVPAGRYARQALTSLKVWDSVKDRIVPTENVRVAAALVDRGEAGFGVVYATDAMAQPGLRVVGTFPPESHTPIRYPMALLKTARHRDAGAFRDFLLSGTAQRIFLRHGFAVAAP